MLEFDSLLSSTVQDGMLYILSRAWLCCCTRIPRSSAPALGLSTYPLTAAEPPEREGRNPVYIKKPMVLEGSSLWRFLATGRSVGTRMGLVWCSHVRSLQYIYRSTAGRRHIVNGPIQAG